MGRHSHGTLIHLHKNQNNHKNRPNCRALTAYCNINPLRWKLAFLNITLVEREDFVSKCMPVCVCVCVEVGSERGFDATCQVSPVDSSCLVATDTPKILSHPSSQLSCLPSFFQIPKHLTERKWNNEPCQSAGQQQLLQPDGKSVRRGHERKRDPHNAAVKFVSTGRRTGEIDFELLSVEPMQKKTGMMHDGCLLSWMSCWWNFYLPSELLFYVSQPLTILNSMETIKVQLDGLFLCILQCKMSNCQNYIH